MARASATGTAAVRSFAIIASGVLAIGCGRLGFSDAGDVRDAPADVAGDAAASELCPWLTGVDTDSDLDGIGDRCDPHPNTPGDHIGLFATLGPGDVPFDDVTGWTQEADGIRFTGLSGPLTLTHAFGNARIELGFEIHALVGNGQHQVASGITGSDPYYFVELNENGSLHYLGVESYDNANGYMALGQASIPGMHAGTGVLQYDTGPTWAVHGGWTNELYDATAATPAYASGATANFIVNGLDVTLTYLAIIDSP